MVELTAQEDHVLRLLFHVLTCACKRVIAVAEHTTQRLWPQEKSVCSHSGLRLWCALVQVSGGACQGGAARVAAQDEGARTGVLGAVHGNVAENWPSDLVTRSGSATEVCRNRRVRPAPL